MARLWETEWITKQNILNLQGFDHVAGIHTPKMFNYFQALLQSKSINQTYTPTHIKSINCLFFICVPFFRFLLHEMRVNMKGNHSAITIMDSYQQVKTKQDLAFNSKYILRPM